MDITLMAKVILYMRNPKRFPLARAHSELHANELRALGWTLSREFRDGADEQPYEYLFVWEGEGDPIRPNVDPLEWKMRKNA
jgi:hypothetical protein